MIYGNNAGVSTECREENPKINCLIKTLAHADSGKGPACGCIQLQVSSLARAPYCQRPADQATPPHMDIGIDIIVHTNTSLFGHVLRKK